MHRSSDERHRRWWFPRDYHVAPREPSGRNHDRRNRPGCSWRPWPRCILAKFTQT
ncbi:hypothetical protein JG688_00010272 [Phytophthora aleatoria]|uniref:Uncharacterized protein n=1 Tax=Phytophthora aleatoria TaxID=2496075 RepID=A0A8J5IQH9_9STRA|nr:hypothetical protein JG688_00010272 [Phytophthora aleatoria]